MTTGAAPRRREWLVDRQEAATAGSSTPFLLLTRPAFQSHDAPASPLVGNARAL